IPGGGAPQTPDVPGAPSANVPYSDFGGQNVTVVAPGVQFTGGLAFASSTGGFTITVTNVTLGIGGTLAVATGVSGTVVVTSSGQTPVLTPTLTATNLAVNVPGFMINGPIS